MLRTRFGRHVQMGELAGNFKDPTFVMTALGFSLVIGSMVTTYYKDGGVPYSVFGSSTHGAGCLGKPGCGPTCDPEKSGDNCNTVKAFSIMAAIFSFSALALMSAFKLDMSSPFKMIPVAGEKIGAMLGSSVGLIVLALFSSFVAFMVALLSDFKIKDKNLVDMSNKGTNSVELTEGFHMAWASILVFIIALITSSADCAMFENMYKKMY